MLTIIAICMMSNLEWAKPENFSIYLLRPAITCCFLIDIAWVISAYLYIFRKKD